LSLYRILFGNGDLFLEEKRLSYTSRFRALLSEPTIDVNRAETYPFSPGEDELAWMMRHDQSFYLPGCLMVKTDIASMANSLEVRCPFLDHRFIEFAARIPSHFKHDGLNGKLILKSAVKDLLHPDLLTKPKTGFSMPVSEWFRGELAPMLRENLLAKKAVRRGLIDLSLIKKMIGEHMDHRRDWSNRLWAFLFLELWFREFID